LARYISIHPVPVVYCTVQARDRPAATLPADRRAFLRYSIGRVLCSSQRTTPLLRAVIFLLLPPAGPGPASSPPNPQRHNNSFTVPLSSCFYFNVYILLLHSTYTYLCSILTICMCCPSCSNQSLLSVPSMIKCSWRYRPDLYGNAYGPALERQVNYVGESTYVCTNKIHGGISSN
jgi:hypothetical protein